MFRKILHSVVVFTLLIGTSGVAISKHYCGNTVVSISINHTDKGCGMNGGCCHNETTLYKVIDNFAGSHFDYKSPNTSVVAVIAMLNSSSAISCAHSNNQFVCFTGAPPITKNQSFLKVFRC